MHDFRNNPHLLHTVLVIAVAGGATWGAIHHTLGPLRHSNELVDMLRVTTLSAGIAGLTVAPIFGREGLWGVAVSLLGAVVSTAIGAALAAMYVGGPAGVIFGPMYVFQALIEEPLVLSVWVVCMSAAHAAAAQEITPENSGSP